MRISSWFGGLVTSVVVAWILAVSHEALAVQQLLLTDGARTYYLTNTPSQSSQMISADFNEDGQLDLAIGGHTSVTILLNSNGVFLVSTNFSVGGKLFLGDFNGDNMRLAAVKDFNDDHSPDILWQRSDGVLSVWLMSGTNFVSSVALRNGVPPPSGWKAVSTHDFNEDNSEDILFEHDDGRVMVWLMDGMNYVTATKIRKNFGAPGAWRLFGAK